MILFTQSIRLSALPWLLREQSPVSSIYAIRWAVSTSPQLTEAVFLQLVDSTSAPVLHAAPE